MKNKKAFTFVELIVSITIIAIMSTIWFVSYNKYLWDSRDSQRKSDLAQIWSALKVYKQKRGYAPLPWSNFNITYSWTVVAYQWYFDNNVHLNTLDKIILDPKTKTPYLYSIVKNKQEYEIAATLENRDVSVALVNGTYKSISRNILPWIILAIEKNPWENAEIKEWTTEWDINREKFIFNNQSYNLPYTFETPYSVYSDTEWNTLTGILDKLEENNDYWQNTDYRNCLEIDEWWKLIIPLSNTPFEYQIITKTWSLTNTWCSL